MNYYIFKKRPKTKVHSLINVYRLDIILLFIMFIVLLFIPSISYLSAIPFTMLFIYAYLLVEAKYRLREYLKSSDSIIKITEDGSYITHYMHPLLIHVCYNIVYTC